MKLVINEKFIQVRRKIAQILMFSSLAVLVIGLIISLGREPSKVLYSYICLIIGFILSSIGMFFTTRYGRDPRYDELLNERFKSMRNDYTFYVFSSPVPYLLLGPCGFWITPALTASGEISYVNGKWQQKGGNFLMKLMGHERLGKPEKDAGLLEADLRTFLEEKGIPPQDQPDVKVVYVRVLEQTKLGDLKEAPSLILDLKEVKRYIRQIDRESCTSPLTEEQTEKLTAALESFSKR
ncbi:MAG: hypothetical protein ACOYKD_03675 [Anaerolineaceae bacterium]|jgi:hypothetical protein